MNRRIQIILLLLGVLTGLHTADAQTRPSRGPKSYVRGGMVEKPDAALLQADSVAGAVTLAELDSLTKAEFAADSMLLAGLRTDLDSLGRPVRGAATGMKKKGGFMSDSMSLSKMCWVSAVLPGYGQVYNKQYWKLPVLYGTLGAGLALFLHENKTYRPLKETYDAMTLTNTTRTPELDALQASLIRSNTRRQIYLGATIASYIYFLGDAAVNYSTNDVSSVKKATTLACICPGAGQIYNKSYWKVPFVIGGFAAMIYCIDWNSRGFKRFQKAYSLRIAYENDPNKEVNYPNGSPDEFHGRYTPTYLKDLRNNFRRNRDLCIILTGAIYILQIVDAHVDAHLKDYDISDDLSMNIEPLVNYTFVPSEGANRPVFGFNLNFKF